MKIQKIDNVSFNRKPNQKEMVLYTNTINEGLKVLGKEVGLIMHNASAPSVAKENVGIGSLFSRTVQEKLVPFLKSHGFSHIQQEPNALRKVGDPSPYAPESSAKNVFMIPLEKLTSEEYGSILSKETFNRIVSENPKSDEVDYDYVRKSFDTALREAYGNAKNTQAFQDFKAANEAKQEKNAIFRILSKENNETYWETWNELDRTLYVNPVKPEAQSRINELKTKYSDEYDYFLFQQMILENENKQSNKLAEVSGMKIMGDSPVAQTQVDEWVHQKLFLEDKAIGCPPDYFSKDGQRWGFKYYKPEEMFNEDGSLGKAGEILKKKYEEYFESFPGGIRIDHVIGLVDPFIYTVSSKQMTAENSGRIFSQGGKYQKNGDEYANIFEKIILPAAKKYNLDKSSIICENLGHVTNPTKDVMNKLGLEGIFVTEFGHRGIKATENNTIMLGSHDNKSFLEYTDELFAKKDTDKKSDFDKKMYYLWKDIRPDGNGDYINEIRNNKSSYLDASFAELFMSPARRVQVFFTDLFGIPKTYNKPGTTEGNWQLRASENFENDYYKAASEGKAPNFPKSMAIALEARGLGEKCKDLINTLKDLGKIIAEK